MRKRTWIALGLSFVSTGCMSTLVHGNLAPVSEVNLLAQFKTGVSCQSRFLGIFVSGKNDVISAAKNGSVKSVKFYERSGQGLPMILTKSCVTVYGE